MKLHPEQLPAPRHNGQAMVAIGGEDAGWRMEDGEPMLDASVYHEAAVRAQKFYKQVFAAVKMFKGPRAFAFDCALLALGWHEILGCNSQVELARKWKCTKANVEKAVGQIQALCGIPETADQRDESARQRMAAARERQLR